MKKNLLYILLLSLAIVSCHPTEPGLSRKDQTVIFFFPWSTNLGTFFEKNILSIAAAVKQDILNDERIIIAFAQSQEHTELYEVKLKDGEAVKRPLKDYYDQNFSTTETLTTLLTDIKEMSNSKEYALVISAHGKGWLPVADTNNNGVVPIKQYSNVHHNSVPLTRFFGGITSETQIEIPTLTQAITRAGMHMEYIAFDACYMANIEIAYELRNVSNYLIASTAEIMAEGFPYEQIAKHMIGEINYQAICDGFYDFYCNYEMPYGTLSAINCQETQGLADIMKRINTEYDSISTNALSSVQYMCGYEPTIFYDHESYVSRLCADQALLNEYRTQLKKVVPYEVHTEQFITTVGGMEKHPHIYEYSGITSSAPSLNADVVESIKQTAWYIAAH